MYKDIPGYEGYFQIDETGKIKGVRRVIINTLGNSQIRKEKVLKYSTHRGYYKVILSKFNKIVTFQVHRLVGLTFIPNPLNLPQINHKNGIKTDNRVENLEWCTGSENVRHSHKTGLKKNFSEGEKQWKSVITETTYFEMKKLRETGMYYKDIAKIYNMNKATVHAALTGHTWKHLK